VGLHVIYVLILLEIKNKFLKYYFILKE
jgi:hypothetical protein